MKVWNTILKIVAALAVVAGIVYIVATYGDKIVAWAKKLLKKVENCCGVKCTCECECTCEDDCCEENCCCEEAPVEEVPAEEAPVESCGCPEQTDEDYQEE